MRRLLVKINLTELGQRILRDPFFRLLISANMSMGSNALYGGVIICGMKEHDDHTWEICSLKDGASLKKAFLDTLNNPNKVSDLMTPDNAIRNPPQAVPLTGESARNGR